MKDGTNQRAPLYPRQSFDLVTALAQPTGESETLEFKATTGTRREAASLRPHTRMQLGHSLEREEKR